MSMTTIAQAKEDCDTLEALVDRHGLAAVISALAGICHGKADHLATNWQDQPAARQWTSAGGYLDRVSDARRILAVTP